MSLQKFCEQLPKVDLHAHLNGSLSTHTLLHLGVSPHILKGYQLVHYNHATSEKLKECFKLFKIAHDVMNTFDSIYSATKFVIKEFHEDNVIYLELRTTPKETQYLTKREYLKAVIRAIQDNQNSIVVKLIASINREHDSQASRDSLDVILKLHQEYPDIIKGLDLSGNPNLGKFDEELFTKAREHGLFITLHCAEVKNDEEVEKMLKFKANRIGHATCIHPNYGGSLELWKLYQELRIPIECCLTSNVLCETSKSYKEHHTKEWIKYNLPFSINTDDKGVFNTTASNEYLQAALNLGLTESSLINCSCTAIESSFATKEEKARLLDFIMKWKKETKF